MTTIWIIVCIVEKIQKEN